VLHHPPVSYFYIAGPNKNFKYYGYYLIEAKAGLNSLTLINKGKRTVVFKDGQKITFDYPGVRKFILIIKGIVFWYICGPVAVGNDRKSYFHGQRKSYLP
jgi:hypothetical protein